MDDVRTEEASALLDFLAGGEPKPADMPSIRAMMGALHRRAEAAEQRLLLAVRRLLLRRCGGCCCQQLPGGEEAQLCRPPADALSGALQQEPGARAGVWRA